MPRTLAVAMESWPIRGVFRISRGARTEAQVVDATVTDGDAVGRGECVPYASYGDRKIVVWGESVSVRVDLSGRRIIKQKKRKNNSMEAINIYVTASRDNTKNPIVMQTKQKD